jgi:S1-C subfamily serine protease
MHVVFITAGVRLAAATLNMQMGRGVCSGSKFSKKGEVRLGDVILRVNEHHIRQNEDLLAVLELYNLNDTVNLVVLRGDETHTIPVLLSFDREDPAASHAKLEGYI